MSVPHLPELRAIPVVEETKFLGIIFDRKLSFLPHIRHLKEKCTKALNLLRVVAHTTWGADQQTLTHLYRSLIRSKLEYCCDAKDVPSVLYKYYITTHSLVFTPL